jgi:hypothetical protein
MPVRLPRGCFQCSFVRSHSQPLLRKQVLAKVRTGVKKESHGRPMSVKVRSCAHSRVLIS